MALPDKRNAYTPQLLHARRGSCGEQNYIKRPFPRFFTMQNELPDSKPPTVPPSPSSRYRSWCFTKNNYAISDCDSILAIPCRYVIFGKEVAPTTGTPHLQGYISFESAKSRSAVAKLLPGCHLLVARGTASQNKVYCSKGGQVFENGVLPADSTVGGRMETARWDNTWSLATSGRIEEIDSDIRLRYYTTIKKIGVDYMPPVKSLESVCGVWIYGASGAGKTRAVLASFPEAYIKPRNVWWDGYQQEEVVLLDDVDKFDVALGGKLKHWADFPPFIGEIKGISRRIRPSKLIVTSQYKMEEIWNDAQTLDALGRRFKVIEKIKGQDIIL
ncbi:replication-associated protein [Giant house spider associated circular virus 3]|uniref:replication-associated protein n=1 Tax=Giant house spider associated circular virus 3 TaxID=2293290 RepID=UPI000E336CD0|nr:replication-associated protein [Giant house spider associated circular virus 3]AXL65935.1 replication-associated protein [Giant house spider associated circular virus 3]